MMYVCNKGTYLIDRKFSFYELRNPYFTQIYTKGPSLFDGELIRSTYSNDIIYLMYDIVSLNGVSVGERHLKERLEQMTEAVRMARVDESKMPFLFKRKSFLPKRDIQQHINNIKKEADGHYWHTDSGRKLR